MGYIELTDGVPDSRQFVLSFWFRIPQATLDAATAEAAANGHGAPPFASTIRPTLSGVVPLVVFGPQFDYKGLNWDATRVIGSYPGGTEYGGFGCSTSLVIQTFPPGDINTNLPTLNPAADRVADPSYIGVDCNFSPPRLAVNINIVEPGSANIQWITPSSEEYSGADNSFSGSLDCSCYSLTVTHSFDGAGGIIFKALPEVMRTLPVQYAGVYPYQPVDFYTGSLAAGVPTVSGGRWHHVIVSVDTGNGFTSMGQVLAIGESEPEGDAGSLSDAMTRTGGTLPKLWISFDDANMSGDSLSVYASTFYGGTDPNQIFTPNSLYMAQVTQNAGTSVTCALGTETTNVVNAFNSTYSVTITAVKFGSMAVPASGSYVDNIRLVEIAELQLFTNIAADTSDLAIRRLFVTNAGTPAAPTIAQGGLGQAPDVRFHLQNDFIGGVNTGTAGNFDPTGTIIPFTPGPSIGG